MAEQASIVSEHDDDDNCPQFPGLTVGQLRAALADVPDDMPVTVYFADEDGDHMVGGIMSADCEGSCSGHHLTIYASPFDEDFEDEDA